MSNENKFIDGLIVKPPHERAPEYVIAKLSIKRLELIAWLQKQDGEWINADIKESQGGKFYAAVDDWKPGNDRSERQERPQRGQRQAPPAGRNDDPFPDESIPF
jgi:hypothetical protein